jgi:hypothetical protein
MLVAAVSNAACKSFMLRRSLEFYCCITFTIEAFMSVKEDEVNADGILSVAAFIVASVLASNVEDILSALALIPLNIADVNAEGILAAAAFVVLQLLKKSLG